MSDFKKINGTPWHIGTISMSEDDERRHRNWCVYFRKDDVYCYKRKSKCIGSAHCDYYKEDPVEAATRHKDEFEESGNKPKIKIDVMNIERQKNQLNSLIGSYVEHSFYGDGKVVSVEEGKVTIAFDNGETRKFSTKDCIEKGFLKVIDNNKKYDADTFQNDLAQERTDMAQTRTNMAESRTSMARKRTGMAEVRTDMAFERTALSNSQTLLAYIRTAIATFAAGIGMFEFVSHPVIIKIGVAFMVVAPIILVVGFIHFFLVRKKMEKWERSPDDQNT